MIKILSQPVGGGRKHFRSSEFTWPGSSSNGDAYTDQVINHGLNSYTIETSIHMKTASGTSRPYNYYYDLNINNYGGSRGWKLWATSADSVLLRMYYISTSANLIVLDIYAAS